MSDWKFRWVTSWDEVLSEAFQAKWQRWIDEAANGHVFYHPALARAWIETYRPIRSLEPLFLVAHMGAATIFYPLVLWRQNWKNAWRRLIVPVGYSDFDYNEPLAIGMQPDFARFWEELVVELKRRWGSAYDCVDLGGVRESAAQGNIGWALSDTCARGDVSAFSDVEAFLGSLKKSLRGDLGRQRRRLSELGALVYHDYTSSQGAGACDALKPFLARHAQRWPNAYKAPGFHEKLLQYGLPAGVVHFSELRVNGRSVSWHLGFIWNGQYYYYMPVIDPEFANYSPGKVNLLFCVEFAINSGLKVFDHLRGDEDYKAGWASEVVELKTARWLNRSMRSGMVDVALNLRKRLVEPVLYGAGGD